MKYKSNKQKKLCLFSAKDVSDIIYYVYLSDIFIGNDSFGHHVACQMNKPIILIDTPLSILRLQ